MRQLPHTLAEHGLSSEPSGGSSEATAGIDVGQTEQRTILETIAALSSAPHAQVDDWWAHYQRLQSRFGQTRSGELAYRHWLSGIRGTVQQHVSTSSSTDSAQTAALWEHVQQLEHAVLSPVTHDDAYSVPLKPVAPPEEARMKRLQSLLVARRAARSERREGPELCAPLFILSPPRSGSTLLFEALRMHPQLWSLGGEAHEQVESLPELHPSARDWSSNALTAKDVTPETERELRAQLAAKLVDGMGQEWRTLPDALRPKQVRFLEKTPKNVLRIPFWQEVFPDAQFLFLLREAGPTLSSMLECWRSGRFIAYPELPGWPWGPWSLLLPPDWQTLENASLAEIVAHQWRAAMESCCTALEALPASQVHVVRFESLVHSPVHTLEGIAAFAGLDPGPFRKTTASGGLPLSSMVQTPPSEKKWLRHEAELKTVLEALDPLWDRCLRLAIHRP